MLDRNASAPSPRHLGPVLLGVGPACLAVPEVASDQHTPARLPEMVEVRPLTDRIVMLHLDEGYVEHHRRGMARSDARLVAAPLDPSAASRPETYAVTSTDDAAHARPRRPTRIGRKSKGTDIASFVDRLEDGRAVDHRPDHAKEHWIYLELPEALRRGKTHAVTTARLASSGRSWRVRFDEQWVRSDAVHVNLLRYVPAPPRKSAYISHWMGDLGSLDLRLYGGEPSA